MIENGDEDYCKGALITFLDRNQFDAVCALSRPHDESYANYIDHVAINPLATRVNIADLRDNLRPERAGVLTPSHRLRYEMALERLERPIDTAPPACEDG